MCNAAHSPEFRVSLYQSNSLVRCTDATHDKILQKMRKNITINYEPNEGCQKDEMQLNEFSELEKTKLRLPREIYDETRRNETIIMHLPLVFLQFQPM